MISIPPQYGYVLLTAMLLGLELIIIGYAFPGALRQKYFNQEFMDKKFGQQHQKAFGKKIDKLGYPDMGSGYYSKALSYPDWYKFNCAQRAHYSFLEMLPSNLVFLLVAGIGYPMYAASFGIGIAITRLMYAIGYSILGPFGRYYSVFFAAFFTLSNIVLGVKSCLNIISSQSLMIIK